VVGNRLVVKEAGISYSEGASGSIEKNDLKCAQGILAGGASYVAIRKNRIIFEETGLIIKDEAAGLIKGNLLIGDGKGTGIEVEGMSDVEIVRNKIARVQYGIVYKDAVSIRQMNNKIEATTISIDRRNAEDDERKCPCDDDALTRDVEELIALGYMSFEQEKKVNKLQTFVLKTRRLPGFRILYKMIYSLAIKVFLLCMRNINEIRVLYLRRGLTTGDWIPGSSDVDLFMVIDDLACEKEIALLRVIWGRYSTVKKVFPFLGELQIGTEYETKNYLRYGDARALEMSRRWKPLYGDLIAEESTTVDVEKLRIDFLTEIFNSFRIVGDVYFNRRQYVNAKELFLKAYTDILKHALCFDLGKTMHFDYRADILSYYEAHYPDISGDVIKKIKEIWVTHTVMSDEMYDDAYRSLFAILDARCSVFRIPEISDYDAVFQVIQTGGGKSEDAHNEEFEEWKFFFEEIERRTRGQVKLQLIDAPGLLYIIIEETMPVHDDFIAIVTEVRNYIRAKPQSRRTPFMILTPALFQMMIMSLHLETPFNYFKLPAPDGCGIIGTKDEERRYYNHRKEIYHGPSGRLLTALIREAVTIISISLRMFERSVLLSNRHKLIYLYVRILGLQMAVEKGIIVSPFIDNVLVAYEEYYPEHRDWICQFRSKYLDRPISEVNILPSQDVFYDNYPFLQAIMRRLNQQIDEVAVHGHTYPPERKHSSQ
jgi:hypothetical protein